MTECEIQPTPSGLKIGGVEGISSIKAIHSYYGIRTDVQKDFVKKCEFMVRASVGDTIGFELSSTKAGVYKFEVVI